MISSMQQQLEWQRAKVLELMSKEGTVCTASTMNWSLGLSQAKIAEPSTGLPATCRTGLVTLDRASGHTGMWSAFKWNDNILTGNNRYYDKIFLEVRNKVTGDYKHIVFFP